MFGNWLRNLTARKTQPIRKVRPIRRAKPRLEALEDRLAPARLALFFNATYSDIGGDIGDEATEIQAALQSQGNTVTTFSGISAAAFSAALADQDALVIPELENANLNADLTPAARAVIANFVSGGGGLILAADSGSNDTALLNAVFGFTLTDGTVAPGTSLLSPAGAAGTPFAGGPATLPDNNLVSALTTASLPAGARSVYNVGTDTTVAAIGFGAGNVVFLGYDWFNALPAPGSQDGGWNNVLNRGVQFAPRTAATLVWTGDVDANWGTSNAGNTNWASDLLPRDGDTLLFPLVAANRTNTNNIAGLDLNAINFGGVDYVVGGNAVSLNGATGLSDGSTAGANQLNLNVAVPVNTSFAVTVTSTTLTVGGALSGNGALTKTGVGTLRFTGFTPNTNTGTVTVAAGTLVIEKGTGIAGFGGDLVVGDGIGGPLADTVVSNLSNSIPNTSNVTVASSGLFVLSGSTTFEAINNLSMTGGAIDTSGAALQVNGTLTATSDSAGLSALIEGALTLVSSVQVNDGPGSTDLEIGATIDSSVGLTKNGTGTLLLSAANTYTGATTVNAGTLALMAVNALPTTTDLTVNAGATVDLNGNNQAVVTINGSGTITNSAGTLATLTVTPPANDTFAGLLTGNLGLTKNGGLTLTLTNLNTYTGPTDVVAGTLLVNGSITSATTVESGATLGGTGRVGDVLVIGTLSPGTSPSIMNTGSLTFAPGSNLLIEINGPFAGTQYDVLNVTGTVTLQGPPNPMLTINLGFVPTPNTQFGIILNDGADAIIGPPAVTFNGVPEGGTILSSGTVPGRPFGVTYVGGDGNDFVLTFQNTAPSNVSITPTPATINEGQSVSFSGSFTDVDTTDTHTVVIDFGDGTSTTLFLAAGVMTFGPVTKTYTDNLPGNAPYTVTATVVDNNGGSNTGSTMVTVNNVAPAATISGAPATSPEGTPITVSASATDVSPQDAQSGFVFNWSVTKNGNPFATGTGVNFTFTPDDNGTFVISLTATDKDGGVSTAATATVNATNVAPSNVAIVFTPASINENDTVMLSGTFTDPGVLDNATVVISWGDGSMDTTVLIPAVPGRSPATPLVIPATPHQYLQNNPNNAPFTVTVSVTDKDGGQATPTPTAPLVVRNVAPTITSLTVTPNPINENGTVTLNGTFTDPGTLDLHQVVINWGDGTADTTLNLGANVLTFSSPHQYLDNQPGNAPFTITVTVTDQRAANTPDGGVATMTTTVTVNNVAPSVAAGDFNITPLGRTIDEGQTVNVFGAFTDPGTKDSFTLTINWGDGTVQTFGYPASTTSGTVKIPFNTGGAPLTHTYVDNGVFTITTTLSDKDGGTVIFPTVAYTVRELLIVRSTTINAGTPGVVIDNNVGTATFTRNVNPAGVLIATFTDAGRARATTDYVAAVSWGDGTTNSSNDGSGTVTIVASTQVVNGATVPVFEVRGTHTFTVGTFAICVSVREVTSPSTFTTNPPTIATLGAQNTAQVNFFARILTDRFNGNPLEGNVFTSVVQSNAAKISFTSDDAAIQQRDVIIRVVLNSEQFFVRTVRDLYRQVFGRDPVKTLNGVAVLSNPTFRGGAEFVPSDLSNLPQDQQTAILSNSQTRVVFADKGAQGWVSFLAQGTSIDQLRLVLFSSQEYFDRAGGNNTAFVNRLYTDVLGRSPNDTDTGKQGWINALNSGASRNAIVAGILFSFEGRARQLDRLYLAYLGRVATGDGGSTSFVNRLFNGGATENQILQEIVRSPEYINRTQGLNINNQTC